MTRRSWTTVRLGDNCVKIGSGSTPRGGDSVYQDSGVSFIRSQNVYNGQFTPDGLAHLNDKQADQLKGVTVKAGDVLLNITGDSVGRSCRVPDEVLPARVNQHVAIIRPKSEEFDSRFVGYFFISPFMQDTMLSLAGSGGTRKALTKEMIERFQVPQPPLSVQSRIADILAAHDELIENNKRRMALLEDAARQLYREWFVRLRFPGHEHTRIANGVPEGWVRKPFGRLLEHHIGGGWGQDEPQGNETEEGYVIRGTDIPDVEAGNFGAVGLRYHDPRRLPQRILQAGDIIFEVSGGSATQAIGRTLLVTEELLRVLSPRVICASFCKLFRVSDPVLAFFLVRVLRHIRESGELSVFQKQSASALQNFQYQSFLEEQEVLLPATVLINEFSANQATLLRQQQTLAIQNYKLSAGRDLLLPRLMSGEIAV